MSWELTGLLILGLAGYSHLLHTVKNKYVMGLVRLNVESIEKDKDSCPKIMDTYSKGCPFIVTPVPGMEFQAAGIEGAVIKRVIIDEQGLIEVLCLLKVSSLNDEYEDTCKLLDEEGWQKKIYV